MDEPGSCYSEGIWMIVDHIAGGGTDGELAVSMDVEPPDPDEPLDVYRHAFGCPT